jgi:hypothetical protein
MTRWCQRCGLSFGEMACIDFFVAAGRALKTPPWRDWQTTSAARISMTVGRPSMRWLAATGSFAIDCQPSARGVAVPPLVLHLSCRRGLSPGAVSASLLPLHGQVSSCGIFAASTDAPPSPPSSPSIEQPASGELTARYPNAPL